MHFDDLVGYRQSDAGAVDLLICFVEFIFDLGQILCLDAAAVVSDHNLDGVFLIILIDLYADHAALGRIFERVVDDVEEHLFEAVFVAVDDGHLLGVVIQEVLALGEGAFLEHIDRLVDLGEDIHALHLHGQSAALELGEVEQLLYQRGQARAFLDDDAHALFKRDAVGHAVLHGLRPALDGGQRCAQLVRYARDKVVFELLVRVELLCHIVDAVAELTDLIVIHFINLGGEIALRDLSRGLGHFADGSDDRADKIVARNRDGRDDQQSDDDRDDGVEKHP